MLKMLVEHKMCFGHTPTPKSNSVGSKKTQKKTPNKAKLKHLINSNIELLIVFISPNQTQKSLE